jgi:hypothetical protein
MRRWKILVAFIDRDTFKGTLSEFIVRGFIGGLVLNKIFLHYR